MITAIHQPHFLPWMGYLNKALNSNTFVWLDNVQFRRRYFQNRAKIRNQESWMWLALPIHADRETLISEVTVADPHWRKQDPKSIECSYGSTPFFRECWPPLQEALLSARDTLDDVNFQSFIAVLKLIGREGLQVVSATDLPLFSDAPTGRLVEICQVVGADQYVAGRGGQNYMELDQFEQAGIKVIWQDFDFNSVEYPRRGRPLFPVSHLSTASSTSAPKKRVCLPKASGGQKRPPDKRLAAGDRSGKSQQSRAPGPAV